MKAELWKKFKPNVGSTIKMVYIWDSQKKTIESTKVKALSTDDITVSGSGEGQKLVIPVRKILYLKTLK